MYLIQISVIYYINCCAAGKCGVIKRVKASNNARISDEKETSLAEEFTANKKKIEIRIFFFFFITRNTRSILECRASLCLEWNKEIYL